MPPALLGGPPGLRGAFPPPARLRRPAPDAFPLLLRSGGRAGLGRPSAGGIGIYTAGEGLAPEPTPSRPPEPPASVQRPASSPQPAGTRAGSGHGPGPAPARRPGRRHLAPVAEPQVVSVAVPDPWQCHRQRQGRWHGERSLWRSPRPLTPVERCHRAVPAHGWRVPSPCPAVPCQPWIPRRTAQGEHGAWEPGWGRYPGAGDTGAVPGVFIGGDASGGHAAPDTPLCLTGMGSVPGRMPGWAGSGEGRQPHGDALHPSVPRVWHLACLPWEGTGGRGQGDMGSVAGSTASQPGAFPPTREEGVRRQWKHGVFSCEGRAELAAAGSAGVPGRAGGAPQAHGWLLVLPGHPTPQAMAIPCSSSLGRSVRVLHPPLAPSPAPPRAGRGVAS